MVAMAAVLSFTGIRDYSNRMMRRQTAFGMITESSLAGVQHEFGSTLCQRPLRSSCHHRMCSKRFRNRSTGGKANQINIQHGIWIVYKKWACNGPRILGRCQQTLETPGKRCCWSAREMRWVCDSRLTRETGGGNCGG